MDTLMTMLSPEQSSEIAKDLSHIFPLLAISAGTVSLFFVIYFIASIVTKISNNKRTTMLQQDIHEIKMILEKQFNYQPPEKTHPHLPKIKLPDGAIAQDAESEHKTA